MKRFTLMLTLAAMLSMLLGGCVAVPYGDGYRGDRHDHDRDHEHDRGGYDDHRY